MRLFNVLPFIGTIVLGALSVIAQDATPIISGIDGLTTESQNLQKIVANITPLNAAFQAAKIAPEFLNIGNECKDLIKLVTVPNPVPFGAEVATDVRIALVRFVQAHQLLLNTLIGKNGIIARFPPFGSDIAAVLRVLEGIIDSFAFALIGLIPTEAGPAKESIAGLDNTFANTIKTFA